MAWNNKKIKRLFDRTKRIATSRHNIEPEWFDNLTLDDVHLFDGNQKTLAYIRGVLCGIQMADNGFAPVTPSKIEKVSSLTLSRLENKGNVCRFYFCGENKEETFFDFSFDFEDFFVSVDELDDVCYGKVDDNHWPAGFIIPSSIVKAEGYISEYSCRKYLFAKETKMFYLGMSYEDFFEIINIYVVNCFLCCAVTPILFGNTGNIHSCIASESAHILKSNNCCVGRRFPYTFYNLATAFRFITTVTPVFTRKTCVFKCESSLFITCFP